MNASIAQIALLGTELNAAFRERTHEVTALLVALLAGEHVLLLGPPGTGKSAITQALASAMPGRYFERLMTRFTVPEELFGPFSVQGLKSDRYERQLDGYLPTADVAFLDEIFKANSAILNALLTALNEGAFDQGSTRIRIPLRLCVGASNELPEDSTLDALYDRFVMRRWVAPIASRDQRKALISSSGEPEITAKITVDQLAEARAFVAAVTVPEDVVEAVLDIRDALATECAITISDRRLRKCMKILRAHAALMGRTVCTRDDLLVLVDAIWRKPDERAAVLGQIVKVASPALAEALRVKDAAVEVFSKVPATVTKAQIQSVAQARGELARMLDTAKGLGDHPAIATIAIEIQDMINTIGRKVAAALAGR